MRLHTAITANLIRICLTLTIFTNTEKNKAFESWGYSVDDAKWLQAEMERQAREQYISGEYTLGKLDIRVTIPRKDGSGDVSFIAGWMVLPNDKLKLNTPYGGK